MKFVTEIDLGNETMRSASEVFEALRKGLMVERHRGEAGIFRPLELGEEGTLWDGNGNRVGTWRVEQEPTSVSALAEKLVGVYGSNPQEVGPDGHEDDFGDLFAEALEGLLGANPDDLLSVEQWSRLQEVASDSSATEMEPWLAELAACLREIAGENYRDHFRDLYLQRRRDE